MTFKLANNDGHANQSGSGLPITVQLEDFAQSGWMCSCSGCISTLPPSGPGHQANHWHKSLDAGENLLKKKGKMAEANNATHEK